MGILIAVGQLILSLSILIVLHEGGHFLPSKWFGVKVEKFYLFFDAGIKMFGKKLDGSLFKHKIGETEYGIGWLPLGGYVKIAGMMDESFDKEQLAKEPEDWEFRAKPAWQRLIIMIGGVTVNFILGIFLLSMVLFTYGKEYIPAENATYGIAVDSLGLELGLQDGDRILTVGNTPFDRFNPGILIQGIAIDGAKEVTVERDGRRVNLEVPADFGKRLISETKKGKEVFTYRLPFVVGKVAKGTPAEAAGFAEGDSITMVNNRPTPYFSDFVKVVKPKQDEEISVTFFRDNAKIDKKVTVAPDGKVGLAPYGPDRYFTLKRDEYGIGEAFSQGTRDSYNFLATQVKAFKKIFTGDIAAKDSLGGFISIGGLFGDEWLWERFWYMTGILSLILGFMNLLPIPILDGGHVVFLLYEMVTGRTVPEKVMEYMMYAGLILIGALMIFANGNDLVGLWNGCN